MNMFFTLVQRKEYSDGLNRHPDNLHVRVEVYEYKICNCIHTAQPLQLVALFILDSSQHLFTCDLDGQEMKSVNDCVAKLKRLDAKGRLWPQQMIMECQGGYLLLNDIETKVSPLPPFFCLLKCLNALDARCYT